MPIYELGCPDGHVTEVRQSFFDALPPCPHCGAATVRLPTRFAIKGRAKLPPALDALPQTWKGTYDGNKEYVTGLRKTVDERLKLEERHPELAGDQRPILAHEGRFASKPLRAGDEVPPKSSSHNHGGHSHGGHAHEGHSHHLAP